MTFAEFRKAVGLYTPKDWRLGQSAFNGLCQARPDLSERIRGTDLDPFHRDSKLLAFWVWVEANWGAKEQDKPTLAWVETFDEFDNSIWEAASALHDESSPFYFRLVQRLDSNRIVWQDSSDTELTDGDTPDWPSLEEAKAACEQANRNILHECSEEVES